MKRCSIAIVAALAALLVSCAPMRGGSGWATLIDGERGLENFNQVGDANWHAQDGAIVADKGKSGFLVTKNTYQDFELRAEFWAETDTNSGVFIRCADAAKITGANCYEVNIWDIRPEPKYGTGAIVDLAAVPVPVVYNAGGRWNTYEISAKGDQLTAKLNGVQTASARDSKHPSGYIALQMGPGVKGAQGGPIKWRNVRIRPL